ncbi:hypothetical protein [Actinokineospora pegani]|uniref:hypothetical protein n=1 Tax=Actinokineospora pegani TaxID=2654637 RepID=UPI0012EABA50|nr:hypothetical protein [Actinokineospora pegani]
MTTPRDTDNFTGDLIVDGVIGAPDEQPAAPTAAPDADTGRIPVQQPPATQPLTAKQPPAATEPPTAPIPVQRADEPKKGFLARLFNRG